MQESLAKVSDEEIIQRVADKQKAFAILYERYRERAFRFIYPRLVKDSDDALDITQQGFVNAYKNMGSFDPNRRWKTWLFSIMLRLTYSYFRSRNAIHTDPESEPYYIPKFENELDRMRLGLMVDEAVSRLNDFERIIIKSFYFEGKSEKEISAELRRNVGEIRRARKKGLRTLKFIVSGLNINGIRS